MIPGSHRTQKLHISVMTPDRVGLLRDIAAATTELDGNIEAISQHVVDGYFTLTAAVVFPPALNVTTVREALHAALERDAACVSVVPSDVPARDETPGQGGHYVLLVSGSDRPGILKCVSTLLAARAINIEDWSVDLAGDQVTYVGAVWVPDAVDIDALRRDLGATLEPMELSFCVQHENIVRVTQDIGPIAPLLEGDTDA